MQAIRTFLWFDDQAEEAATFYTSLFKNSRIVSIMRWSEGGPGEPGRVGTVEFELDGRPYVALNGGPEFTFTEAISLQIDCDDQDEVDHYWKALGEGGEYSQCGWLKDKYGLSWQVVPRQLFGLISGPDSKRAAAATQAMLKMQKLDVAELQRAYDEA
ncbi:MAG TPA: VOC family protein [Mycobacteriales bacterium]|jgi:predicted 3-demethylubiquinone-9 3-methyltransferase (glyoxalase superfamily)|nr:VOC family protein [Mycobacteriales bacterium]